MGLKGEQNLRADIEFRILSLRYDQIATLLNLAGLKFSTNNIEHVVDEILREKNRSIHLDILLTEAKSQKDLLWWIDFFEKQNIDSNTGQRDM